MTREAFIKNVVPGTIIYDGKRKTIAKVVRLFPDENPSYAEYIDSKDKQPWGVFYKNMLIITPEKLAELKAKQAVKHDISSNNSDIA